MLTYRLTKPPFRFISLALGVLVLVLIGFMIEGIDFGLGAGGIERMIAYPELLWSVALGGYLLGNSAR